MLTLETFEWDNTWIEHAENTETPRVLVVGDSISCGWRRIATDEADHKILFDGFGTSKSVDNPWFLLSVLNFAEQQYHREAIIINNGLHGVHLSKKEYSEALSDFIKGIVVRFPTTPVFLATSTPGEPIQKFEEMNKMVRERNDAMKEIAEFYGTRLLDFYEIIGDKTGLHIPDGVHLEPIAYKMLAQRAVSAVKSIL